MISSKRKPQNIVNSAREYLGMNKQEFANLLGMSRKQIYNLETEKSMITKPMYLLMSMILEHKEEIFKLSERMEGET